MTWQRTPAFHHQPRTTSMLLLRFATLAQTTTLLKLLLLTVYRTFVQRSRFTPRMDHAKTAQATIGLTVTTLSASTMQPHVPPPKFYHWPANVLTVKRTIELTAIRLLASMTWPLAPLFSIFPRMATVETVTTNSEPAVIDWAAFKTLAPISKSTQLLANARTARHILGQTLTRLSASTTKRHAKRLNT